MIAIMEAVLTLDTAPRALRRPDITLEVTRGAARLLVGLGFAPLAEVSLPNGRRADLMALGPRGEIAIVEVKSSLEDFRVDQKWGEYAPFCERFYFAVAPDFPRHILPDGLGADRRRRVRRGGAEREHAGPAGARPPQGVDPGLRPSRRYAGALIPPRHRSRLGFKPAATPDTNGA